jgi:hypothetical protein
MSDENHDKFEFNFPGGWGGKAYGRFAICALVTLCIVMAWILHH